MNEKQVKDAIRAHDAAPSLATPKTMYVASIGLGKISTIEVIKETEKTVSYRPNETSRVRRQNKTSTYEVICGTWCEAHAILLKDARQKLINATARKEGAEEYLKKIEEMPKN